MAINDGFSGYWDSAAPGKGIDADWAMAYRNTDVGKHLLQTLNTGVASWPSKATSLIGELVGKDEWKLLRKGDRRICDYVKWAVRNGQENFRVAADVLKGSSTELHASLRMNLFFGGGGPLPECTEMERANANNAFALQAQARGGRQRLEIPVPDEDSRPGQVLGQDD